MYIAVAVLVTKDAFKKKNKKERLSRSSSPYIHTYYLRYDVCMGYDGEDLVSVPVGSASNPVIVWQLVDGSDGCQRMVLVINHCGSKLCMYVMLCKNE